MSKSPKLSFCFKSVEYLTVCKLFGSNPSYVFETYCHHLEVTICYCFNKSIYTRYITLFHLYWLYIDFVFIVNVIFSLENYVECIKQMSLLEVVLILQMKVMGCELLIKQHYCFCLITSPLWSKTCSLRFRDRKKKTFLKVIYLLPLSWKKIMQKPITEYMEHIRVQSKVNLFIFAIHQGHLGLKSKDEHDTLYQNLIS